MLRILPTRSPCVCLSASAGCSDDALDAVFRAAEPLTYLAMDYSGKHWAGPWNALAIVLNGRAAVVDLGVMYAEQAVRPLAARCAGVRTLALCEELWPFFAAEPLPVLRELTVRILPPDPHLL